MHEFVTSTPPHSHKRQEQAHSRRVALDFISNPMTQAKLAVFSCVINAQQDLMRRFLDMASENWDKMQDGSMALAMAHGQDHTRKLRVNVAYSGDFELEFIEKLASLLSQDRIGKCLQRSEHIVHLKVLAFRLISCAGGFCYQALIAPHKRYPLRLFALATGAADTNGDLAACLRSERRCLMDEWSRRFLEHYGDDLNSRAAKADLTSTALLI